MTGFRIPLKDWGFSVENPYGKEAMSRPGQNGQNRQAGLEVRNDLAPKLAQRATITDASPAAGQAMLRTGCLVRAKRLAI